MEIYVFVIMVAVAALALLAVVGKYIGLWFQAFVSGTPISLFNIIGMSLRKIPARVIVNARINAYKAGLKQIAVADLETHYLARGHVIEVVAAMIAADKANIPLTWRQATAIDLAGRDILDAVRTSVYPRVIDCPDKAAGKFIIAVAKNGIQLKCRARVTVRTNIAQLVGGATEETVIARVGEGIVSAIGSANTHLEVLEAPDKISRLVLNRGLDAQTAFEILSIDIADIDVGDNIGARLQGDQAEADMRVARAHAEKRRALAVATEQESIAEIKAMEAKKVEAEAQIPLAIASALTGGKLSLMDYFRMRNIQADTDMRASLAQSDSDNCKGAIHT